MESRPQQSSSAPHLDERRRSSNAIVETEDSVLDLNTASNRGESNTWSRRRSSIGQRFSALRQYGGPNSFDNFARSFERAANFRDITPRRSSVFIEELESDSEDEDGPLGPGVSGYGQPQESLLTQKLSGETGRSGSAQDSQIQRPTETSRLLRPKWTDFRRSSSSRGQLDRESSASPQYGSVSSLLTSSAQRRASVLADEQYQSAVRVRSHSKEYDPDVRRLELHSDKNGEVITRVVGGSTVPMTVFNLVNSLVGIGMLAMPLAMSHTGWLVGFLLFTAAAFTTYYTAGLLTKCLDTNTGAMTYSDISYMAFGTWGRSLIEALFFLEMIVGGTGLIVLFGDSIHQLVPIVSVTVWQVVIAVGLLPLNFVPFKFLSLTSILGIFCTMGLILMVFTDGLIKPSQPGSLRRPAVTDTLPANIRAIPLSIGLFMAPWGGHPVIPGVYRDMRHPAKFKKAARTSYVVSYALDISMAIIGYLMFGNNVMDEVTAGILRSKFYPAAISFIILLLIAVISTTKLPLTTRPIIDTVAGHFENHVDHTDEPSDVAAAELAELADSKLKVKGKLARYTSAVLVNLVELTIAIIFPSFDSIMILLGSAFCITISIILPISFYLQIFSREGKGVSMVERVGCYFIIFIAATLAILGTIYAIVPRDRLGL